MPYARVSLARASRPAQKDTLSEPARTASTGRTRSPPGPPIVQHSGESDTRVLVPGCQGASHHCQGSAQANMSGTLSSSPAEADACIAARMANGTGRVTRLTRSRPCGCNCYSTLVRRKSIRYERAACSLIGACCAAHTWVHTSPLSGPSRCRRRPRDTIFYAA